MSSSSPEQSLTPTASGKTVHNTSACSVTSTHSEGAGGADYPPPNMTTPVQRVQTASNSSPNSPLPSRGSSGKLQRGVKKLLRIPQTPTSGVNPPPTLHEDPLAQGVANKEALFARMLMRGTRKIRKFRRNKRRGVDKQYHSDDGYTSDPGLLREEDDDETDGDVDEIRRQQQMRNLERKIEKIRSSLPEEEEVHGSEQDLVALEDKSHRSKLSRNSLKNKSQRKKLENWETQLRMLQEGAPLESRYSALRDKIGGGLRGMSLGLRGRLTFKPKGKRYSGSSGEGVIDDEDEEALDDLSQATEGVIHMETEEFSNEGELLPMLKDQIDEIRQTSEDTQQENQNLKKELDEQKDKIEHLQQCFETIFSKLEQEKERAERLETQVNDITELHQHEVGELRAQIGQMENVSISKNQDLEDAMEACNSKLERLGVFVHRLTVEDNGAKPEGSWSIRKPVTTLISLVLMIFTLLLKFQSFVRTKTGLVLVVVILLIAVLFHTVLSR